MSKTLQHHFSLTLISLITYYCSPPGGGWRQVLWIVDAGCGHCAATVYLAVVALAALRAGACTKAEAMAKSGLPSFSFVKLLIFVASD